MSGKDGRKSVEDGCYSSDCKGWDTFLSVRMVQGLLISLCRKTHIAVGEYSYRILINDEGRRC